MKEYKFKSRILSIMLAGILAIPVFGVPQTGITAFVPEDLKPVEAYGAIFSDIKDHWAKGYIEKASKLGFVNGYNTGGVGYFAPDWPVNRAEFTTMINKAFQLSNTVPISFKDVPYSEWYYKQVATGISAAVVGGYDDGTFKPTATVSRQEAAVMLARIIPMANVNSNLNKFSDRAAIADWARESVGKVAAKGYLDGYEGKYHPTAPLTRAQCAKILCDILEHESIVTSSSSITQSGSTLANRIYTKNLTVASSVGSGDVTISNTTVLGTLYVNGGGENTVTLSNSRVANTEIEKSSGRVRVLAKGQTSINRTTAGKEAILETSSLSGGYYGTGFNQVNIKSSADILFRGNFPKVAVDGSNAKIDLEKGTVDNLDVTGRNSKINVQSEATVTNAEVGAASDFTGNGTIKKMNIKSNSVTYTKKPNYVTVGAGYKDPGASEGNNHEVEVRPADGKKNISRTTSITLTFDTSITDYDGGTLSKSELEDAVTLRKSSSSGKEVSCTISLNSSRKVITIEPDSTLDDDTTYYVVIKGNTLKYSNGKKVSSQTTRFSTGNGDDDTEVRVNPSNGETKVSRKATIKLTFKQSVTDYQGDKLSSSEIRDAITIRKGTESGSKVEYTSSINSDRTVITLEPDNRLEEDTTYYVSISSRSIKYKDGTRVPAQTTKFFTGEGSDTGDLTFSPTRDESNISVTVKPTIKFPSAIETYTGKSVTSSYIKSVVELREGGSGGTSLSFWAEIDSAERKITIEPKTELKEGTKYYLYVPSNKFRTQKEQKNVKGGYVTWTTKGWSKAILEVASNPVNGEINVAANKPVVLSFSSSIYDTSGTLPTKNYLENSISFKNANSGNPIGFSVTSITNTGSGAKVVVTPDVNYLPGNKYTLTIANSRLRSAAGNYLGTTSFTFTAAGSVNLTNLNNALARAKAALKDSSGNDIQVSDYRGADVNPALYWVSSAAMSAFKTAINEGETALTKATTTDEANNAASKLEAAITSFVSTYTSNGKGTATNLDKTSLEQAIEEAKALKTSYKGDRVQTSAFEGWDVPADSNVKWCTEAHMNAFNNAINAAETACKTANKATEVVKAIKEIHGASQTFISGLQKGKKADITNLINTINMVNTNANGKYDGSPESETLASVYDSAVKLRLDYESNQQVSQTQIDEMINSLKAAYDAFVNRPIPPTP